MNKPILALLLAGMLSFLPISVKAQSGNWMVSDVALTDTVCNDLVAVEIVSNAAKKSKEQVAAALNFAFQQGKCIHLGGVFGVTLVAYQYSFIDYEDDLMEVWEIEGTKQPHYIWAIAKAGPHNISDSI